MKKAEVTKVSLYNNALMATTTLHHAYGAMIYNTPWRLHVLMISIPVTVITVVLSRLLARKAPTYKSFLFLSYCTVVLVPSIGMIGLFEGVYNHALKVALFYAGTGAETLVTLFPPPAYEMPNDLWFELTGVLQAVIVVPLMLHFIQLVKITIKRKYNITAS